MLCNNQKWREDQFSAIKIRANRFLGAEAKINTCLVILKPHTDDETRTLTGTLFWMVEYIQTHSRICFQVVRYSCKWDCWDYYYSHSNLPSPHHHPTHKRCNSLRAIQTLNCPPAPDLSPGRTLKHLFICPFWFQATVPPSLVSSPPYPAPHYYPDWHGATFLLVCKTEIPTQAATSSFYSLPSKRYNWNAGAFFRWGGWLGGGQWLFMRAHIASPNCFKKKK